MAEKTISYKWDTTNICTTFDVGGATILEETYEAKTYPVPFRGGMTGVSHTTETKRKMSNSKTGIPRPTLHKGGTVVSPTGEVVHYNVLSHFCQEHRLSVGHVSEMMNGKRHTVKGWKKYGS